MAGAEKAERADRDQGADKGSGKIERGNGVRRGGGFVVVKSQTARLWFRKKRN